MTDPARAPYGVCQDCVKHKATIDALRIDNTYLRRVAELAKLDLADLAQRLEVASGATMTSRQEEAVKRLQHNDLTQRRDLWETARTVEALRHEIADLRGVLSRMGVETNVRAANDRPRTTTVDHEQLELDLEETA